MRPPANSLTTPTMSKTFLHQAGWRPVNCFPNYLFVPVLLPHGAITRRNDKLAALAGMLYLSEARHCGHPRASDLILWLTHHYLYPRNRTHMRLPLAATGLLPRIFFWP